VVKISRKGGPQFATGSYTGDGSESQAITGLGFRPKLVIITTNGPADAGGCIFIKTDQHTGQMSVGVLAALPWGNPNMALTDNRIISLDADGFTVDDEAADAPPNKLNEEYTYVAFE